MFKIPSLKIEGFHKTHGSVDFANELNIPIVKIEEIPEAFENLTDQKKSDLLKNSQTAIEKVADLINEFDERTLKRSGFSSTKKIWNSRKVYR